MATIAGHGGGDGRIHLTPQEAMSGLFGSISLASWVFVLVPQLIENYKQGSADGISITFLLVWFIGDISNLAGALGASLVPTVIALAIYFCFSDLVLILQCTYYNLKNSRSGRRKFGFGDSGNGAVATEDAPLLGRRDSDDTGLPGSHRRKSSAASQRHRESVNRRDSLASIIEEESGGNAWIKNASALVGVWVIGAAGWGIAYMSNVWKPTPVTHGAGSEMGTAAQVLGYISAVCYLGARIPQIIKNWRDKSCEGLSLLFFMLSLSGNLTYGIGILAHSTERQYFLTNLPWLIGSLGTMVEDMIIFIQFRLYGDNAASAIE